MPGRGTFSCSCVLLRQTPRAPLLCASATLVPELKEPCVWCCGGGGRGNPEDLMQGGGRVEDSYAEPEVEGGAGRMRS